MPYIKQVQNNGFNNEPNVVFNYTNTFSNELCSSMRILRNVMCGGYLKFDSLKHFLCFFPPNRFSLLF